MRKAVALAAIAGLGLVAAPSGSAKGPTLRSLQGQITSLQKQVKTLKKRVTTAENIGLLALVYSGCSTAVTADAFQDTFTGLDGYFGAHSLPAYFGTQGALNDYEACVALDIVRAHNQNPPNTNVLRALLDIFKPSSSSAAQESRVNLAGQARQLFGQFLVLLR
jgi:hypothetical protein